MINWTGELLICDFGQARPFYLDLDHLSAEQELDKNYSPTTEFNLKNNCLLSHQVCTRWYRAPELLYGSNNYDFSIDIWSFGCIIAELFQKKPLFVGQSDIEQLGIVTGALGEPPFFWSKLPDFNKIIFTTNDQTEGAWLDNLEQNIKNHLDSNDKDISKDNEQINKDITSDSNLTLELVLDLIQSVLKYTQRKTAQQLFNNHQLFNEIRQTGIQTDQLIKCNKIIQMTGPHKKNFQ